MAKRLSREEMKKKIRQVAMDLLDQKSYQQVTMNEIASKAQISKRTLYKYYPSKSNLFITEFKSYFEEFRENIVRHDIETEDAGMKMKQFMQSVFNFTKDRPAYYKLLLTYQAGFFDSDLTDEELKNLHEHIRSITTSNRNFFDEYWNDTLKTGLFADKTNSFLFQMLIAMNKLIFIEYYYNQASYAGDVPSLEEMLKMFSDMLYVSAGHPLESKVHQ